VLQTESGSLGQVINNENVVSLPLNGRGAFSLIGLVPGVTDGTGSGTQGASSRINGGRNRLNEIQLNGITAVNIKGGSVGYTPMVDALQEFKILTNSFAAEYGRTGGGVILGGDQIRHQPIPRHYLRNFSAMTPSIRGTFLPGLRIRSPF
jgi:hypothetical protein